MEQQVDVEKVIQSLLRQISEHCQKIAILEAYISKLENNSLENKES